MGPPLASRPIMPSLSTQGTRRDRGDVSCCQRSTAREEGLRLAEIGMLAGLGWANAHGSSAEGLQWVIPLEELSTGTPILNMRALPEIKVMIKFTATCRAAHGVIPFRCCVPLLTYSCPIICNFYKKDYKIFLLFFLTFVCFAVLLGQAAGVDFGCHLRALQGSPCAGPCGLHRMRQPTSMLGCV